jgi:hypothetical protein
MSNILSNFGWSTLFTEYNDFCDEAYARNLTGTTAQACLGTFSTTPQRDIDLYRQLVSRFACEKQCPDGISFGSYAAMLYWKMYSTAPEFPKQLLQQRLQTEAEFTRLFQDHTLTKPISRDADAVIELIHWHVMTLRAVGKAEKGAGEDERNLKPYFETVWSLEEQNRTVISRTVASCPETPVRLTEMALFVRGHER